MFSHIFAQQTDTVIGKNGGLRTFWAQLLFDISDGLLVGLARRERASSHKINVSMLSWAKKSDETMDITVKT